MANRICNVKYFFYVSVVGIFEHLIEQMFGFKVNFSVCRVSLLFVFVKQMFPFAHGPPNVLCDPWQCSLSTDSLLGKILLNTTL